MVISDRIGHTLFKESECFLQLLFDAYLQTINPISFKGIFRNIKQRAC